MVKRSLLTKIPCEPIKFTVKFQSSNGLWIQWHRCSWLAYSHLVQFLLNYSLFSQETFQNGSSLVSMTLTILWAVNIMISSYDESWFSVLEMWKSDLGKWILLSLWIFVLGFYHFDCCLLPNINCDDLFSGLSRENLPQKNQYFEWTYGKIIIQLCAEDHSWWWRCFFVSGGSSFYVFAYSIFYFVTKLGLVHLWKMG